MVKEFDLYGVYFTPLVIWVVAAWVILQFVRQVLEKINFFDYILNRRLVEACLFMILIQLCSYIIY